MELAADLHTHTLASGHAYGTVDEMLRSAKQKGLELIAITDHGPRMPGAFHHYYFGNLPSLPDELYGVELLTGVEANIQQDGSLDLSDEDLRALDFVAAGIHFDAGYKNRGSRENTRVLKKVISHPRVDMITHPFSRSVNCDLVEIVRSARNNEVILEINASSFASGIAAGRGDREAVRKLCHLALRYENLAISLNSDAHFHHRVGEVGAVEDLLHEAGLPEERLINSSLSKLKEFLACC